MKKIGFIFILAAMMAWGTFGAAEDIQNDSGCDVCDGAIHYGPDETREIFGDEIREKINEMRWQGQKNVWIDLDGVWKNTESPENESHFELKIYGTILKVFVKSLMDGSVVELVLNTVEETGDDTTASLSRTWNPEIYFYAGHAEPIDLSDSVDAAWKKIKERHVYQWIGRGKDLRAHPEEMRRQLMNALTALSP